MCVVVFWVRGTAGGGPLAVVVVHMVVMVGAAGKRTAVAATPIGGNRRGFC